MGHDWTPGDVAMVECSDGKERQAICGRRFLDWGLAWVFRDGSRRDVETSNARPLVVIDTEDREQVGRLCKALVEAMHRAGDVASAANGVHPRTVISALTALVAPPKPEEPTGLGAVVRDAEGHRWVRTGNQSVDWYDAADERVESYDDIAAVKVLSQGWSE